MYTEVSGLGIADWSIAAAMFRGGSPGGLLIGPTQTVFETDLQTGMSEQPGPRAPAKWSRDLVGGEPDSRSAVIARFRRAAMTCGPWPVRTCERSSSKDTSRTQCSWFSMAQCPRIQRASRTGPVAAGSGRRVRSCRRARTPGAARASVPPAPEPGRRVGPSPRPEARPPTPAARPAETWIRRIRTTNFRRRTTGRGSLRLPGRKVPRVGLSTRTYRCLNLTVNVADGCVPQCGTGAPAQPTKIPSVASTDSECTKQTAF
jgi:hypothetical protein